jgi:carbonic anhydrase
MTEIKPFPPALSQAYQVWKQNSFPAQEAAFTTLARDGQAPDFMVISCCDSRVLPTDIFGAGAGDMFVHRNIANLVPAYAAPSGDSAVEAHGTSAALEYGVCALKVAHVLVLGHAQCGGVQGCHDMCKAGKIGSEFDLPLVGAWLEVMRPVYEQMAENHGAIDLDEMGRQSIVHSLNNLLTFPFIAEAVAAGKLGVHGAWYDISTGALLAYNRRTDSFVNV